MQSAVTPPPELPEQARPRWPWWYGPLGFLAGALTGFISAGIVWAALGVDDASTSPGAIVAGTALLDGSLVGAALLFASFVRKPRAWHFGLRRTAFWPAVGWAALGMVAFYVFAAVYQVALHPDVKQTVAEDLGAGESSFGLIAAGFMIICVAPFAEEFFFRGFFYGALRTKFGVALAATIDGLLFGVIHFEGGTDGLLIVPPLAVLGLTFCLIYERTRSLYPVIALHAINNSIAYAAQADGGAVSAVLGPLMLLACVLAPRLQRPAPSPL
ncbi:MAG: protease family protein [Thermoleophilaceae bacterium]|jgi:membrane protease YdiL (CAAX protease family)|nr:protease family protein [Thermoleophilaceae bacterium]MEA2455279.1 protease family protein [Thermoleophilaceae bacterium]